VAVAAGAGAVAAASPMFATMRSAARTPSRNTDPPAPPARHTHHQHTAKGVGGPSPLRTASRAARPTASAPLTGPSPIAAAAATAGASASVNVWLEAKKREAG